MPTRFFDEVKSLALKPELFFATNNELKGLENGRTSFALDQGGHKS
jgi:hypothetical protein